MSSLSSLCLGYRKTLRICLIALALLAIFTLPGVNAQAQAKELHVAAAADLRPVMPAIAEAYEHATGIHLVVSYGSSSTLATQIISGAPFDLFLAADYSFPEKVVAAGLADTKSPTPYAYGTLVLWARKDSPVQPLTLESPLNPKVKSIAIADDTRAPYGLAAVRSLTAMHQFDAVKDKLVRAENIEQAGQFAESGNAQLAFLSMTLAKSPHMQEVGSYVLPPLKSYPPINQCAVVMKNSKVNAAARDFLNWLTSKPIQEKLRDYGLTPVN